MNIQRPMIGLPTQYSGRKITVRYMGPDFLGYVDEVELAGFFITPAAAESAAQRYINDEIEAARKKGKP